MKPDQAFLAHWRQVVQNLYGIDSTIERLDGEYDLNFRVIGQDGTRFILKVMRPDCDPSFIDMQCRALEHIKVHAPEVCTPDVIRTLSGDLFTASKDGDGSERLVWMLSHLDGTAYGSFSPQLPGLVHELGSQIGLMDKALSSFDHPELDRDIKWDMRKSDWIEEHIDLIDDQDRKQLIGVISERFTLEIMPTLVKLPHAAIHNDVNDYNILVSFGGDQTATVSGLIDFGDMVHCPRVCDLAIAGAYIVLDQKNPVKALSSLVAGYHSSYPLTEEELALVFPLVLTRLAVSVVNSTMMAREKPDDPYVVISQAPAWRFLDQVSHIDADEVTARLRIACDFPATQDAERIASWITSHKGQFAPVLGKDLSKVEAAPLSIAGSTMPGNPLHLTEDEAIHITGKVAPDRWELGLYAEPRLIYTGEVFSLGKYEAGDRRTVHIGVDIFAPAGTQVSAPLDGVVCSVTDNPDRFDYGGVVILEHSTPDGDRFQTLYGHLNPDVTNSLSIGETVPAGETFALLGSPEGNGGWRPHLHFQLCVMLSKKDDIWVGVADADDLAYFCAIHPNPASLLNLDTGVTAYKPLPAAEIAESREKHFTANLKLSYRRPCLFLRGWKHYLIDEMGRRYLDAYNNVPHVGHAHPRLQALAYEQLGRLNSNTRYLHPAQIALVDKLLSKVPDRYSVCFFVNSGSEANELSLRLARAATGGKDMITPDHGYHGMTTGAIDISAYKFNKPNGVGQSDWVQLVTVPDSYRYPDRTASDFASEVDTSIANIKERGGKLAGFIAETFPSVGGQVIPPDGYLKSVYRKVRAAGGICIADEVQTGLGRLGSHYWAFEIQDVEPDIIVLGKPLGNGHPVGAVITTREIADAFANGIEYFSTFGGSTLSCRLAREVLQIVDDEGLQENARTVGASLQAGLRSLMDKHACVGDVRGHGLFIGFELVQDRETREPATEIASYLVNRLREQRVLVGTEGPSDNILKIRPPLTIDAPGAEKIVETLDSILNESFCRRD